MPRHAATKPRGRYRAPDPIVGPENLAPLTNSTPIVAPLGERRAALKLEKSLLQDAGPTQQAAAVATTTGLILLSAMSGTIAAHASNEPEVRDEVQPQTESIPTVAAQEGPIAADAKSTIIHPKVTVKSEAAPPPPPPAPEPPAPVVQVAPPAPPAPPQQPAVVAPPAPPATAPAVSGKAAIIAYAARSQIGVWQDCTMLVTNSLAAAGINFHDWPIGYMSLGHVVSAEEAIPGDLLYYAQNGAAVPHIAVYIGNGRAIHGGWNGNQTVEFSVNVGQPAYGPTAYIRVH